MARTHTLVEYRLKEYELERTLRALQVQQQELDYQLDLEFFEKLSALSKQYGYSYAKIFDLLKSRYEGRFDKSTEIESSINIKTNANMLELLGSALEPRFAVDAAEHGQCSHDKSHHEQPAEPRPTSQKDHGHELALECKG